MCSQQAGPEVLDTVGLLGLLEQITPNCIFSHSSGGQKFKNKVAAGQVLPSKALGRGSILASPSFWWVWAVLGIPWLALPQSLLLPRGHLLKGHQAYWIKSSPPPIQCNLILTNYWYIRKALFPNKVTF